MATIAMLYPKVKIINPTDKASRIERRLILKGPSGGARKNQIKQPATSAACQITGLINIVFNIAFQYFLYLTRRFWQWRGSIKHYPDKTPVTGKLLLSLQLLVNPMRRRFIMGIALGGMNKKELTSPSI